MAHLYQDKDVIYADDYPSYVRGKHKMNRARGIGNWSNRFHNENVDITWKNCPDRDEELGISKQSYRVSNSDEEFEHKRSFINSGKGRRHRFIPDNMAADLGMED